MKLRNLTKIHVAAAILALGVVVAPFSEAREASAETGATEVVAVTTDASAAASTDASAAGTSAATDASAAASADASAATDASAAASTDASAETGAQEVISEEKLAVIEREKAKLALQNDPNHIHNFEWIAYMNESESAEGTLKYMCLECGKVWFFRPISAYYAFEGDVARRIRMAQENETVRVKTSLFINFNTTVMEALANRPDVSLYVSFLDGEYKGNRQSFIIPAGEDTMSLLDENGYCGFLFLGGKYGLTMEEPVNKDDAEASTASTEASSVGAEASSASPEASSASTEASSASTEAPSASTEAPSASTEAVSASTEASSASAESVADSSAAQTTVQ